MKQGLQTCTVKIGNLFMGGDFPVVIQSMTNTDTLDTDATVAQCRRLFDIGCDMVRITAPGMKEARNLENIKNRLVQQGYTGPLVADVHFLPEAALTAADFVEKIRINPGNYCDRKKGKTDFTAAEQEAERERICQRIAPLLERCKQNGTALRIGVNQGSLSERMNVLYGNTPQALVESAMEFISICRAFDFGQLVISIKSSRVQTMDKAVRMLAERMIKENACYPLHLGVTEAGNGEDARLMSAIGIGSLLADGIGNTIRVSLTETPENEIPAAQAILHAVKRLRTLPENERKNACLHLEGHTISEQQKFDAAIHLGRLMLQGKKEGFTIEGLQPKSQRKELLDNLLQAAGIKFHKTRFIACPSCGRTKYDIQKVLAQVKQRFPDYPNLTLAVMGCIVNGPGEMADADFGYIGCGNGKVNLYRHGVLAKANVAEDQALEELEKLIAESKE